MESRKKTLATKYEATIVKIESPKASFDEKEKKIMPRVDDEQTEICVLMN